MFCTNCGKENPDNATVCSVCGAPLVRDLNQFNQAPVQPQQVYTSQPQQGFVPQPQQFQQAQQFTAPAAPKKKHTAAKVIGIIVGLIVIGVLVACYFLFFSKGAKETDNIAKKAYECIQNRDGQGLMNLMPKEIADNHNLNTQIENLITVANDYDIQFKASDVKETSRDVASGTDDIKRLEDGLNSQYNTNLKIDSAYEITSSAPCTYSEGNATITFDVSVAKIDGEYYLVGIFFNAQ